MSSCCGFNSVEPLAMKHEANFPLEILKNRVFLMPFSAFLKGFLCMEQVMNEKEISGILMTQNISKSLEVCPCSIGIG